MPELIRLWHLFRPYRGWMLGGFAVALITLLANVTLMAISAWFITAMAVAGAAGVAMNYFTPAAIIRGSAIARTAGRYFERLITHEATLRQLAGLRVWFYRHLEPLAPARLMAYHSADLLTRIRADIDALDNLYVRVLVPVLVAITAGLAFFVFTALFDLGLALLLLGMLLIAGVLLPWWGHRLGKQPGRRIVEIQAELRQAGIDGTQGLSELLIYGAADSHARHMDALSRALVAEQARMSQLTGIAQAATGLTANLTLWGMLWFGIPLVHDGSLAPPQLAMLALFSLATFEAVAPLPMAFQQLESTLTAARRLFAIVDTEPAVPEPTGPTPQPRDHGLSIEGLRFRYPSPVAGSGSGGSDSPDPGMSLGSSSSSGMHSDTKPPAILDGIDLELPPGRRVAIVGATGSGKTTLFNLLLRFWAPEAGSIRLGGEPLEHFPGEDLRRRIALVSQHTHLFDTSIRENLLIAAPEAPQGLLEQACATAQIHDFIAELPEGYDTWVGETGVRLSGGQARRIAIARALLRDAPILLLDEPTEGLDAVTERALMDAVQRLMTGRTVLLITHKPVALAQMDEILVLDQGRVIERGTHAELLKAPIYPRLLGLDLDA
ncbi:amino acid ABC transporter ATP-binding/permease protein [Halochromatium salexigens]|uniref:Thiol reductant ABC exporter subunit CydC n=1 Tax=Halochromatium salexigens TaxID=49447 RepID=A0AAJ0XEV8_HALSE|nr:ATP-binding cassette domain-containing protein [Halochromatium salexigens]MBK5929671.1 thiol reductant ABC exporter subunit CydC [Halochromatium salexigens]